LVQWGLFDLWDLFDLSVRLHLFHPLDLCDQWNRSEHYLLARLAQ
jgi:hypothetical protein